MSNNVKKDILWRVYLAFTAVAVLAFAIIVKIVSLQTVDGAFYTQLAKNQHTRFISMPSSRGNIYADDGSLLATSIPIYEVRMDMKVDGLTRELFNEHVDSLAWCLSDFFKDKTKEEYEKALRNARRNGSRFFLIKRKLDHTQLKELRKFPLFRLGRYKGGLVVIPDTRRKMPFMPLALRTIGYTKEGIKPVGLEGAFNNYLAGSEGKRLVQKVSGGAWMPINDENEVDPKDGQDIITTIDVNFQDVTHNALLKVLASNEAHHGCAVVMEVATGHIKAISNLTRSEDGNYWEEYNYAIGESMEPGSTFKLASMIALLEDGQFTPNSVIDIDGGEYKFFDRVMRDSKAKEGSVTLKEGFEISSNVAISKAVYQAFAKEPAKFVQYLEKMRLNERLGLHIAGEGKPFIKNPRSNEWNGTSLPWMSIGYELKLTPLQTLSLYNAVANNGKMVKPQLVTEIREVGKTLRFFPTEVLVPQICSEKTLGQVQKMLEGVVEEGTAKSIKNDMYKIAGKTGTALIANAQSGYKKKIYQASFAGYFPANKPMYSIIVVITNPQQGVYYGGALAGPVFREIADKIYAQAFTTRTALPWFEAKIKEKLPFATTIQKEHLQALANNQRANVDKHQNADFVKVTNAVTAKVSLVSYVPPAEAVPDVKGMVLSDAIYQLEKAGLRVVFTGKGKVTAQSIEAGSRILRGQTINISLN